MPLQYRTIFFIFKYIRLILIPLSPLYLIIFYFKRHIQNGKKKFNIPIICIGNITTGGTGKTPTVIYIAKLLREKGYKPGIISRGYGGTKSKKGGIVTDGANILLTPEESGDEPYLMAKKSLNLPIAIGKNRIISINNLIQKHNVDIIIMDDGFQNNTIYKDISIITIDAINPFGNGLILPAGDLREPKSSLKRSHLLLISKSNLIPATDLIVLSKRIQKIIGHNFIFNSIYKITYIYQINNSKKTYPVTMLEGKKILLITAIGNPKGLIKTVKKLNPDNISCLFYPDHYNFIQKNIEKFIKKSKYFDYVILTEKDYVKVKKFSFTNKFYILNMSLNIENEEYFELHLAKIINRCKSGQREYLW